eukprot:14457648-Alexandrium_andersonii.AAC.1
MAAQVNCHGKRDVRAVPSELPPTAHRNERVCVRSAPTIPHVGAKALKRAQELWQIFAASPQRGHALRGPT